MILERVPERTQFFFFLSDGEIEILSDAFLSNKELNL